MGFLALSKDHLNESFMTANTANRLDLHSAEVVLVRFVKELNIVRVKLKQDTMLTVPSSGLRAGKPRRLITFPQREE